MSAATIYGLGDEGCAQMMCKRCKHVFCWTTSFCGTTTAARAKTSSVTPAPPFCGIARKWSASSPASASCFWSLRRSCC
ncbi:unnamed protein product [Acanthoscelides obtectus]|uniref:Uncharacterized protein n=1 Tax=Acanthoscelides obtectus TaxID=200917 RepID=A0A9P0MH56_ACAOB|nr:unnamed protein product [Acanthoscelides obtectus]CAH2014098.1 unnamed protein product [Acanthoscelides obtectus]CAK1682218.1 hypothetical protein AOBTE_LOCUS33491 [Acanthoscelides obtectus]CAK1682225.1 hypothetical protein AOBTE_LOCUS33497 [Acanthoscelides obtectus]